MQKEKLIECLQQISEIINECLENLVDEKQDKKISTGETLIGDYLLKSGYITRSQLQEVTKNYFDLQCNDNFGNKYYSMVEIFIARNYIEHDTVSTLLSRQYNFPVINLKDRKIDSELFFINDDSYYFLNKYKIVPYVIKENKLYVAMLDPTNGLVVNKLQKLYADYDLMLGVTNLYEIEECLSNSKNILNKQIQNNFKEITDLIYKR